MVQRYCRFSVQKDNAAAAVIECQADAAAVPQVAMMRRVARSRSLMDWFSRHLRGTRVAE
jgi:hypothetical protein